LVPVSELESELESELSLDESDVVAVEPSWPVRAEM
jgi:hypothetical protein